MYTDDRPGPKNDRQSTSVVKERRTRRGLRLVSYRRPEGVSLGLSLTLPPVDLPSVQNIGLSVNYMIVKTV